MDQLTTIVKQVLETDGWNIQAEPSEGIIYSKYVSEAGEWVFYARMSQTQVAFYSLYPEIIPSAKQEDILKLLTALNDGLIMGNFEFNFDDRELRFKTSLDVKGTEINPVLCRNLIYNNIGQMEKCFPGIYSLVHNNVTVKEALKKAGLSPADI